jgi:DNA-directed RNA polymerase subunit RPC12/RpoP
MIVFRCPGCSVRLQVPDAKAGKKGKCPRCGGRIVVPTEPPPVPLDYAPARPRRAKAAHEAPLPPSPPGAGEGGGARAPAEAPSPGWPAPPRPAGPRAAPGARPWAAKSGARALPTAARKTPPEEEDAPIDATVFVGGMSRGLWIVIASAITLVIIALLALAMWVLLPGG